MKVGFVTCLERGIVADDALIAAALRDEGVNVEPVVWETGDAPRGLDAIVLRSPWNYHLAPSRFLEWIARAAQHALVLNDPETIRWNSHKGYLFELERNGVAIAPTILCKQDAASDLRGIMAEHGWSRAIVKPAISASSFMTGIVTGDSGENYNHEHLDRRISENGQHLLDRILETRDALIQPFMPEVIERGERCLIFIDGVFSHAVQKAPFTDEPGGGHRVTADSEEIAIGERALSILPQVPLYARVDLIRTGCGVDRLMELELIDPELYMRFDSEAPRRFATALLRRINVPVPTAKI
jgi:glutathione synthase/RimK-type ligase-like ATP-grasp enzyme